MKKSTKTVMAVNDFKLPSCYWRDNDGSSNLAALLREQGVALKNLPRALPVAREVDYRCVGCGGVIKDKVNLVDAFFVESGMADDKFCECPVAIAKEAKGDV